MEVVGSDDFPEFFSKGCFFGFKILIFGGVPPEV